MIQIKTAKMYNMDCMDFMADIPDNYYSLALVDPPYGIDVSASGKVGGRKLAKVKDYGAKEWDKQPPNEEYFSQLRRVSRNQIVWGANHFISRLPFDSSCWLVWDKDNSGNFADCELAWTSFDTAVRKFMWRWNGMLQQNMKNKEERIHPTQKPIALYEWIYHNYLPQGGKVIDTHAGSQSNTIAALKAANIEIDAIELDKEYYDKSVQRVKDFAAQLTMF